MNCRLGKDKCNSLRILLYSGARYSIVLVKHAQKLHKKMTKSVRCITQGGDFHTSSKSKVEIVLTKLYGTKIITWNSHVDGSQGNHKYDIILGHDMLSKL